jgi:hypothetical protein
MRLISLNRSASPILIDSKEICFKRYSAYIYSSDCSKTSLHTTFYFKLAKGQGKTSNHGHKKFY